MIRAEAVEKAQDEAGGKEEHTKFYCIERSILVLADPSVTRQDTGTSFGM
jgi:hypothetical protein